MVKVLEDIVSDYDAVFVIPEDNPDVIEARRRKLPIEQIIGMKSPGYVPRNWISILRAELNAQRLADVTSDWREVPSPDMRQRVRAILAERSLARLAAGSIDSQRAVKAESFVTNLEARLAQNEQLLAEAITVRMDLQSRLEQSEAERSRLLARVAETDQLERDLAYAQEWLASTTAELEAVKLASVGSGTSNDSALLAEAREKIAELETARDDLSQFLTQRDAEKYQLSQELKTLTASRDRIQESLVRTEQALAETTEDENNLRDSLKSVELQLAEERERQIKSAAAHAETARERDEFRGEIVNLRKQLLDSDFTAPGLPSEVEYLRGLVNRMIEKGVK